MVQLAGSSRFSAIFIPSLLKNLEASVPIPPKHDRTRGVNVPCSIFRIRSLYFAFFDFSREFYVVARGWFT